MKRKVGILALLSIISVTFSDCKKEDQISPSNTIINTVVMPGDWKVTLFNENGNDETKHLNGYVFKFNTNGGITAAKNGASVNGAWSTSRDDDHMKFIIYFSTPPLNKLNDDWRVVNQTSTTLELEDVSGGNGGVDHLTFQHM